MAALSSGSVKGFSTVSVTVDNQTAHAYVQIDPIAPTVIKTDPISNAVNVPTNKLIKVTFSENIKPGTLFIELKDSNGKLITISRSINGNVLTINHATLSKGVKYTLILHTGCVTDTAGNPLAMYNYSFKTTKT